MSKPSRETIRKRIATRRRNAAIRKRKVARRLRAELNGSMGPEVAAKVRLEIDGAHSTKALQRRVRVLAEERKLPPADYAKLMHKRISSMAIMEFGKKHNVNYDWLLCGDLKGLARMERERRGAPVALRAKQATEEPEPA
jgi:hypothetical protein